MTSSDLEAFGEVGAMLNQILASGRISPSYLFEGADGEGVREAALAFAAALLGGDADDARGERVRRLVRALDHPDLHVLGKDKPTVISVKALSAQLEQAYQKPLEGARQVFVVDPAEAMEPEGVARYLKALEEPPAGTVYLLVSTAPERLPATVLSRVRRVRLPPLSTATIEDRLVHEGVEADRAARAAHWGTGSLARARRVANHRLDDVAVGLLSAARGEEGAAGLAEHALQAIERAAADLAEAAGDAADRRKQYVRELLDDLIHLLAVDARDAVGERSTQLAWTTTPVRALGLLESLGELSAAAASNVTPSILVLELVRVLRRALPD